MKRGCRWGLGCVVVVATSPIWVPGFLIGLAFLIEFALAILRAI